MRRPRAYRKWKVAKEMVGDGYRKRKRSGCWLSSPKAAHTWGRWFQPTKLTDQQRYAISLPEEERHRTVPLYFGLLAGERKHERHHLARPHC